MEKNYFSHILKTCLRIAKHGQHAQQLADDVNENEFIDTKKCFESIKNKFNSKCNIKLTRVFCEGFSCPSACFGREWGRDFFLFSTSLMRRLLQGMILSIVANAAALYGVQYLLADQGFEITRGLFGFLMVGAVLGMLNTFVRPVMKIFGFPLVMFSLGLFLVVINAGILFFAEYFFNVLFVDSFGISFDVGDGFVRYLIAAVLLSIANGVTHWLLKKK